MTLILVYSWSAFNLSTNFNKTFKPLLSWANIFLRKYLNKFTQKYKIDDISNVCEF